MIAFGAFFEICRTGALALLQISVSDDLRGRVMSTQFLLRRLAGALGVAAIGVVADSAGLRGPVLCCAAVALIVWWLTFRIRAAVASSFARRSNSA
jgi:predicted MFS family arabinose efflux permease